MAVILALAATILLLQYRWPDFVAAYEYMTQQMVRDIYGVSQGQASDASDVMSRSTNELKHMLMSTDQGQRASAILAFGEKSDPSVIPALFGLLNDSTEVNHPYQNKSVALAGLSEEALRNLLCKTANKDPANIGILLPFLSKAVDGTPSQKTSMIRILGSVGEPLAVPLLTSTASSDNTPDVEQSAKTSMQEVALVERLKSVFQHRSRLDDFLMAAAITIFLLFMAGVIDLFRNGVSRFLVLNVLSMFIVVGFGYLLITERSYGNPAPGSIDEAVRSGNLLALRTALLQDPGECPGPLPVARHLAMKGDINVITVLRRLPDVEPDDLAVSKDVLRKRVDWIVSRVVMSGKTQQDLLQFAGNLDTDAKKYLAGLLGRLKVRTQDAVAALDQLSQDEDPEVQKAAMENLSKVRGYPEWMNQPVEYDSNINLPSGGGNRRAK